MGCLGAASGGLAAAAWALRQARLGAALLLLAVCFAGGARGASASHAPGPSTLDGNLWRHLALVGTVSRAGGSGTVQAFWLTSLRSRGQPITGTLQVGARSPVAVVPGSTVAVSGVLQRLPARARDGTTGYDDRMMRQGVLAAMPGASFSVIAPPPWWSPAAAAWRARATLAAGVRARIAEPEASILLGELVGIRARLPVSTESDLVDSGLVHVLAVSGLKVAMVAAVLAALLRTAGRRAAMLALVGVLAYALAGGASAAAIRAAGMGSLSLVARVLRRDPDPARNLGLAAALLLGVNPALVGDLSFQYSFLGVAGIQLLAPALAGRMGRLPGLVREGLSVSVAAQLATLPVSAAYFHVVPLASPFLNLLVLPMLGPTMAATAWIAVGGPDPGGVVAVAASGAAHLLLLLAHLGAQPPVVLRLPWFNAGHALAYLAAFAVVVGTIVVGRPIPRLPRLAHAALLSPAGAALVGLLILAGAERPDGEMHLLFLDTPGSGALVTAPDGARLLVDTGSSVASLRSALDAAFDPLRPGLGALLLTSSSRSAAGGLAGLGTRLPGVYMAPTVGEGDVPVRFGRTLGAAGVPVIDVSPGDALTWHGLALHSGNCGTGMSLSISFERAGAWFCTGGTVEDQAGWAGGAPVVIDTGPGGPLPADLTQPPAWVVSHGGAGRGASALPAGPAGWQTTRDGPLRLVCDRWRCRREAGLS